MPNQRPSMPHLRRVPRVSAITVKRRSRPTLGTRVKDTGGGWLNTMKVVFLLERPRSKKSSPSLRQIALVVVTAGLGIMVVRVVVRRKSHSAYAEPEPVLADTSQTETSAQADAVSPESAEAEAGQPESAEAEAGQPEGAEVPKQDEAHGASPTPATPSNDSVPATESSLTDTVQSEMSRRGDAPTAAGGSD